MLAGSIYALWGVEIALNAAALACICGRRLAGRYPAWVAYAALCLVRSLALAAALVWSGPGAYTHLWTLTEPLAIVGYGALAIEVLWVQARHFAGIGSFAVSLAAFFTFLALVSVLLSSGIGAQSWSQSPAVMLCTRYAGLLALIVLLLSAAFYWLTGLPLRVNAKNHAAIVMLLLATDTISSGMFYAGADYWTRAVAQCVGIGGSAVCYLLWCLSMRRAGEDYTPLDPEDPEQLRRDEERLKREWEELRETLLRGSR